MNSKNNTLGELGAIFLLFGLVIMVALLCAQNSCPTDSDSLDLDPFYSENQLLTNIDFEEGIYDPWIYTVRYTEMPMTVDCEGIAYHGACALHVTRDPSTENYHDAEVHQFNIPVERFLHCKVSIATRTDQPGSFVITLMNSSAPWQDYGLYEVLETRAEWTLHSRTFDVNTNDEAARLTIAIGSNAYPATEYDFDAISLICVDPTSIPLPF